MIVCDLLQVKLILVDSLSFGLQSLGEGVDGLFVGLYDLGKVSEFDDRDPALHKQREIGVLRISNVGVFKGPLQVSKLLVVVLKAVDIPHCL